MRRVGWGGGIKQEVLKKISCSKMGDLLERGSGGGGGGEFQREF